MTCVLPTRVVDMDANMDRKRFDSMSPTSGLSIFEENIPFLQRLRFEWTGMLPNAHLFDLES